MIEYNYQKLQGRIVEKYQTKANFSKAIGISEHSLSYKLNNKLRFKQIEIDKICELLNISKEDIHTYFFERKVQEN